MRKDLSGLSGLLAPQHIKEYIQKSVDAPGCTAVRLFHNSTEQTIELVRALSVGGSSVQDLDISELDATAADSLASFLSDSSSACRPSSLAVHHCQGMEAAGNLGSGLAAPTCSITGLTLGGLQDSEVAAALTPRACAKGHFSTSRGDGAQPQHDQHPPPPLESLTLERCALGAQAASALAACSQLKVLHLGGCKLQAQTEAAAILTCTSLPVNPNLSECQQPRSPHLTDLDLSNLGLSAGDAEALRALLAAPGCALRTLKLSGNPRLGDAGAEVLAQGLRCNSSLLHLQLDGCNIGPKGGPALASALLGCAEAGDSTQPQAGDGEQRRMSLDVPEGPQASTCRLQELSLCHNRLGASAYATLMAALAGVHLQPDSRGSRALPVRCSVRVLHLEDNDIRGADLPEHLGSLPISAPLEELHLGSNSLGDRGVTLLAQQLGGAVTGAEASAEEPRLAHLDLHDCGITEQGAQALCTFLNHCPLLDTLLLDGNRLHNGGATSLVAAAAKHPTLRVLKASSVRITDPLLKARLAEVTLTLASRTPGKKQQDTDNHGSSAGRPSVEGTAPALPYCVSPRHRSQRDVYMVSATQQDNTLHPHLKRMAGADMHHTSLSGEKCGRMSSRNSSGSSSGGGAAPAGKHRCSDAGGGHKQHMVDGGQAHGPFGSWQAGSAASQGHSGHSNKECTATMAGLLSCGSCSQASSGCTLSPASSASMSPQHLHLSAAPGSGSHAAPLYRRPHKPLTPEQQALFSMF